MRIIPSRKSSTVKRSRSERWETLRKEGPLAIISMILATYGNMIIAALYLLDVPWIWWSYLLMPLWIRLAGVVFSVLSLSYLYWAGWALAEHFSYTLEVQQEQELVKKGPYHSVRHPIYVGTFFFLLFQVLVSDNWLFLALLLTVLPYLFKRVDKEERMMVENFGDDYIVYMKETGRFFPPLRRHRKGEE